MNPAEIETTAPLSFVILYDDQTSVRTAFSALRILASGLARGTAQQGSLFRFDVVDDAACRDEALDAIRNADFILLSSSFPDHPDSPLARWRALCHDAKSPQGVIVTLAGSKECWDLSIEHLDDTHHVHHWHFAPPADTAVAV